MVTNSISLDALNHDPTRRDQWGRYLVVPPIGGKPTGYTRVTTVAKVLDISGGLAPWKATMTACGMILRRGLRSQWESLIAQYDDPWYANEQSKAACKALVEDCAAVGGARDRADMGISLHAITALVDRGYRPSHLTEETEADIAAYRNGLDGAGIRLDPNFVEITVVLDQWQVAGTFDRLATVPGFDLPMIADLKTGADLSYSWQNIAVQLAGYSRGNAIYQQGATKDGSADKRLPMPEVDQEHGLVMWLNAGAGTLELHIVDLTRGWEAFERSMWTRGWRREVVSHPLGNFQLTLPGTTEPDSLVPVLEASIKEVESKKAKKAKPAPEPAILDYQAVDEAFTQQVRAWLQSRIDIIGRFNDKARSDLVLSWPKDIPTLKGSPQHTSEQLDAIERLLVGIEARHKVPFGESKPEASEGQMARLLQMFPGSTTNTNNDKEPA